MDGRERGLQSRASGAAKTISIAPARAAAACGTPRFTTMPEAVLGSLLVAGGITVLATNFYRLLETDLFAAILLIQSLPFLSAVATEVLERFSEAGNNKAGLPS